MKLLRKPTLWGAAVLVIATVVGLAAAWLYISPPGQKTVTFYTADAASIAVGDQVRIAGIKVGKVQDLTLEPDRVRVRARVDNDAFVGDQSQVDVRMLTVVGGYFVNIVSMGEAPLGAKPIPLERVTMPYNLMKTLADSTKLTTGIDATPIRESLDQLQQGLTGDNTESLSAIVDAGNSLMSTLDRQRGQLSSILEFSNEYMSALNNYSDGLRILIRKISIVEQTLVLYGKKFGDGNAAFGAVLDAISPLAYFYLEHRDDMLEKIRNWNEKARMWVENNGVIVRGAAAIRNKITRLLDAQNAPPELLATDMCIPVPGGPC